MVLINRLFILPEEKRGAFVIFTHFVETEQQPSLFLMEIRVPQHIVVVTEIDFCSIAAIEDTVAKYCIYRPPSVNLKNLQASRLQIPSLKTNYLELLIFSCIVNLFQRNLNYG
jgi:hypothetical protein